MFHNLVEAVVRQFPTDWLNRLFVIGELAVVVCLFVYAKISLDKMNRDAYQWTHSEDKKRPSLKVRKVKK